MLINNVLYCGVGWQYLHLTHQYMTHQYVSRLRSRMKSLKTSINPDWDFHRALHQDLCPTWLELLVKNQGLVFVLCYVRVYAGTHSHPNCLSGMWQLGSDKAVHLTRQNRLFTWALR